LKDTCFKILFSPWSLQNWRPAPILSLFLQSRKSTIQSMIWWNNFRSPHPTFGSRDAAAPILLRWCSIYRSQLLLVISTSNLVFYSQLPSYQRETSISIVPTHIASNFGLTTNWMLHTILRVRWSASQLIESLELFWEYGDRLHN
jgi:hypothetical protein